jgi:hypothetical protein
LNGETPLVYVDVLERLERDGVRYVVIGGVAVVLHGYVRPVFDLDIVVDRAPDEANRAMRVLMGLGFVPTIPLPLSMLTVLRMFDSSNREIDLFVRYQIPFEELWPNAVRKRVGESMVRVASLEHVIREKRRQGRPHDLRDVEGLLACSKQEGLDAVSDAQAESGAKVDVDDH